MDQLIDLLDAAAKQYPIKALCDEVGKAESTLRAELNRQPGYKLGITTAIQIMKHTRDLKALDLIEEMFNRAAFNIPDAAPRDPKPLMKMVANLSKEFSETIQSLAYSMDHKSEGGETIVKTEARQCQKEVKDLIRVCIELQAYLKSLSCEALAKHGGLINYD